MKKPKSPREIPDVLPVWDIAFRLNGETPGIQPRRENKQRIKHTALFLDFLIQQGMLSAANTKQQPLNEADYAVSPGGGSVDRSVTIGRNAYIRRDEFLEFIEKENYTTEDEALEKAKSTPDHAAHTGELARIIRQKGSKSYQRCLALKSMIKGVEDLAISAFAIRDAYRKNPFWNGPAPARQHPSPGTGQRKIRTGAKSVRDAIHRLVKESPNARNAGIRTNYNVGKYKNGTKFKPLKRSVKVLDRVIAKARKDLNISAPKGRPPAK